MGVGSFLELLTKVKIMDIATSNTPIIPTAIDHQNIALALSSVIKSYFVDG